MIDTLTFFPSFLQPSKSLSTVQVPSLAELRRQAEQLASSIPPIPDYSCPPGKMKNEINLPQQSKSRGLPIPFLTEDESWYSYTFSYTHNRPPNSYDAPPPRYSARQGGVREEDKEYIDDIDIGHGYDHIHRLGKNASTPSSSNKLWKTWNGGFRPIHIQSTLPSESENTLRPKREYGMKGSESYAESVRSALSIS
ncbi:hypothetical protein I203_102838 [Kwoniella mangroviensis CBS 8507]|uniref:uncharacterized protein n=1 Tax=Kwoniella mangroviensis CBS 8507 TaxID=1296122 RepID=UPI00080CC674|nr:uncharacterized protein I203_03812 [Kwoniella mangroviensis CBS 8507]OCF67127.1 hypothetical protein I203_03812 [Kwoniella mangroviensis CBS 8507]